MAERKIRRAQTVSPFGVGAIYDFGEESFVAQDISQWKGGERIDLLRLSEKLGINHFRLAPSPKNAFSKNPPRIPYVRFPAWLFCPRCRHMVKFRLDDEKQDRVPACQKCGNKKVNLTPMRFVLVCENGHMDDVDWHYWAHFGSKNEAQKNCKIKTNLKFLAKAGMGGGLASLEIFCDDKLVNENGQKGCGARRSLDKITNKDSMRLMGVRCPDRQPWERKDKHRDAPCECTPQVVQRGASNAYYAITASALDISSAEAEAQAAGNETSIKNHGAFDTLKSLATGLANPSNDPTLIPIATLIANQVECPPEEVFTVLLVDLGIDSGGPVQSPQPFSLEDLLLEEWRAFRAPPECTSPKNPFIAEGVSIEKYLIGVSRSTSRQKAFVALADFFDEIVLAKRLREVRCLVGFDRYIPREKDHIRPDLGKGCNWLPALEVFGEGIFLAFDENKVQNWEQEYFKKLHSRLLPIVEGQEQADIKFLPKATPRFVMLHTFTHLLIRQLAFECGYAASSLRERIYCGSNKDGQTPMAGVLIYTADSDSEGSLGGLVKQGEPELLLPTVYRALHQALWCSGDPVCGEVRNQGLFGMNRGACHNCTIISETSCTHMNVLLDRKILIDEAKDVMGYFNPLLSLIHGAFGEG